MMPRPRTLATLTVFILASCLPVLAEFQGPKGWLGVQLRPTARAVGADVTDNRPAGVSIFGVILDSPADSAGLRARDSILAVDGMPVASHQALIKTVGAYEPGRWVTLTIRRGSQEREIMAQLADRPGESKSFRVRRGRIGVNVLDIPPALREHFGAPAEAGVMVSGLTEGGPAEVTRSARSGLSSSGSPAAVWTTVSR
jgi:S1-C subfamily serine protease